MASKQPRKQRRALYNAPAHLRGKNLHANLSPELREKYGRRSFRVRVGDTVKVMRGDYRGYEGKVVRVDTERGFVYVEGITIRDSRGNTVLRPVRASKVMITKLDLSDKRREERLLTGKVAGGE